MEFPFALPSWLPWWGALIILVPVVLYGLALLVMPFSVFGVKARLEVIEARLDEIQGEIRSLALRLPEPGPVGRGDIGRGEIGRGEITRGEIGRGEVGRPPIPPAAVAVPARAEAEGPRATEERQRLAGDVAGRPRPGPGTTPRAEPRLDWPR